MNMIRFFTIISIYAFVPVQFVITSGDIFASDKDLSAEMRDSKITPGCWAHGFCQIFVDDNNFSTGNADIITKLTTDGLYIESVAVPYDVHYNLDVPLFDGVEATGKLKFSGIGPQKGGGSNCDTGRAIVNGKSVQANTDPEVSSGDSVSITFSCSPNFKSWGNFELNLSLVYEE